MIADGQPTTPKSQVPAPLLLRHRKDPMQTAWPGGGTPFGGDGVVPHIFTVAGRYGVASKVYSTGDEALMDSRENAELMRNELAIMECIEVRKKSTSLLSWHIGPADEGLDAETRDRLKMAMRYSGSRWDAEELAAKVSLILQRTPNLTKLFDSLMDAIWYGRYGTEQYWESTNVEGLSNRAMVIKRWEPRHGDKWVFRYDDGTMEYDPQQIGIRIGPGYNVRKEFSDYAGNKYQKVEATMFGLAYFLDHAERSKIALHRHIIEDGDFNHPLKAGSIHGVGIRSRIYWAWFAYSESLKLLMEYLERSALGIEIWRYPAHNPQAKAAAAEAAQRRGAPGRSILMVPVPEGENAALYDVEIVEPGLQGADVLQNVLDKFHGHKMKRYILGQTLTTEADATGMGSGVADAHRATYGDIVRFDSLGLAETITQDIVRKIQLLNFPGSEGIFLKFSFDTESPQMQFKLDAYRQAWEMGCEIKTDDIFRTLGASRPNEDDDVLLNPAFGQPGMDPGQPMMDMGQMDPALQQEGYAPDEMTSNAQDMLAPVEMQQAQQMSASTGIELIGDTYQPATVRLPAIPYRAPDEAIQRYIADWQEPSKAQRDAGNYKMKKMNWNGMRISIENPKGSVRKGSWGETKMKNDYGYIRGTKGADGDHVDCFIGPHKNSEVVFVVDQVGPKGVRFDEHKCILGAISKKQARAIYLGNYQRGWKCGPITSMTVDQFRTWLDKGCQKSRVGKQVTDKFGADQSMFGTTYSPDEAKELVAKNRSGSSRSKNQGQRSPIMETGPLVHSSIPTNFFDDKKDADYGNYPGFLRNSTDPERVSKYQRSEIKTPIYVHVNKKGNAHISDGGHRFMAARDRGDKHIPALLPPALHEQIHGAEQFATQGRFWDEEAHNRETEEHTDSHGLKEPGEFAPKESKKWEQGEYSYEEGSHPHKSMVPESGPVKMILIGCGNKKLDGVHLGKDIYSSPYFKEHRKYAENSGKPWGIMSALYGFIDPEASYPSYDQKLGGARADLSRFGSSASSGAFAHLKNELGVDIPSSVKKGRDIEFEVLAPGPYANAFEESVGKHATITKPMQGLQIGERNGWIRKQNKAHEQDKAIEESPDFHDDPQTEEEFEAAKRAEGLDESTQVDAQKYSAMQHSPQDIKTANATSRSGGAVGGHPVTIKYVKQYAKPGVPILDFGAGSQAKQAQELKASGLDVTAYDFGHNSQQGLHDPQALERQYGIVYASNVLNVQDTPQDLMATIQEIAGSIAPGGMFIGNLPDTPRKGAFNGLDAGAGSASVHQMLEKFIGPTQNNEGDSHPIYVSQKQAAPQKFGDMGECDPNMKKNGKTTCKIERYRCDEAEPDRPRQPRSVTRYTTDFSAIGWKGFGKHPSGDMHKQSEIDKRIKANYFKGNEDGTVELKSSRTNPQVNQHPAKEGDWMVDDTFEGIHGRDIEQLRHLDPHSLLLSEHDYTDDSPYGNPEGRRDDAHRYAEWAKKGSKIPPISVVETPEGRMKVTNGHRRTAAAKIAGQPIPAWISHAAESPDTPGHATGLTDKIAATKHPAPPPTSTLETERFHCDDDTTLGDFAANLEALIKQEYETHNLSG